MGACCACVLFPSAPSLFFPVLSPYLLRIPSPLRVPSSSCMGAALKPSLPPFSRARIYYNVSLPLPSFPPLPFSSPRIPLSFSLLSLSPYFLLKKVPCIFCDVSRKPYFCIRFRQRGHGCFDMMVCRMPQAAFVSLYFPPLSHRERRREIKKRKKLPQ